MLLINSAPVDVGVSAVAEYSRLVSGLIVTSFTGAYSLSVNILSVLAGAFF